MMRVRVIIDKLLQRPKFAQYGEYLIPMNAMAPGLDSRPSDLGIQDGGDMDRCYVFHIPVEGYYAKSQGAARSEFGN